MFTFVTGHTARAARPTALRLLLRSYATRAPKSISISKPKSIPKSKTALPVGRANTSVQSVDISQNVKRGIAQRLFEEGHRVLYTSPSHKALLTVCFTVAGSLYACIAWIYESKMWILDEVRKRKLPMFVAITNGIGMVFMGFFAGWMILQTMSFVTLIRLVKQNGAVKMQVFERRVIPFLKPKVYEMEPYKFEFNRNVVGHLEDPLASMTPVGQQATVAAEVGGIFRRMWAVPYSATRKAFLLEGVCKVSVPSKDDTRKLKLDVAGNFSNGGKDLLSVTSFASVY